MRGKRSLRLYETFMRLRAACTSNVVKRDDVRLLIQKKRRDVYHHAAFLF